MGRCCLGVGRFRLLRRNQNAGGLVRRLVLRRERRPIRGFRRGWMAFWFLFGGDGYGGLEVEDRLRLRLRGLGWRLGEVGCAWLG